MIELKDISHSFGAVDVLRDISLRFLPGRFVALLGPNGAGKSTLLRIAGGEMRPSSGTVDFDGRKLSSWKIRDLAQRRALLPQDSQLDFPFLVEEVVMLGRSPHIEGSESDDDARIVREALEMVGMLTFARRDYTTLSGGERQRVQLARVLAQTWTRENCALLLDEPVSSLDPAHQHETLTFARRWTDSGACTVAILHDVNLALRYADDAVLLADGRVYAGGPVGDVLTVESVSEVYGVVAKAVPDGDGPPFIAICGRA